MNDLKELDAPNRSLTEPSTPPGRIRLADETTGLRSLPGRLRDAVRRIPLIGATVASSTERPSSRPRDSLVQRSSQRSQTRSRPTTPRNGARRSLTPRRFVDSRRVSAVHEEINNRRRRSSMVINDKGESVYDPHYVGPITADYLRFLCKVVIQERKVRAVQPVSLSESPKDTDSAQVEIPKKRSLQEDSKNEESNTEGTRKRFLLATDEDIDINVYDKSLQLPSDTDILLKSPIHTPKKEEMAINQSDPETDTGYYNPFLDSNSSNLKDERVYDHNGVNESKPKTFSYLEKILSARKSKNLGSKLGNMGDSVPTTNTSPEFSKKYEDKQEKIESLIIRDESSNLDFDKISDNAYENNDDFDNENGNNTKGTQISFVDAEINGVNLQDFDNGEEIVKTQDNPESPFKIDGNYQDTFTLNVTDDYAVDYHTPVNNNSDENIIAPQETTYSPNKIITPKESHDNLDGFQASSGGSSPTGLIQEEYTLDHNDNEVSFHLENELDIYDEQNDEPYTLPNESEVQEKRFIPSSRIEPSSNERKSFSINSIKKLVKSIQLMNSHNGLLGRNFKTRNSTFSPEIYEYIQSGSESFLESIVSDLTAYSLHRTNGKNSQINIEDVLLLLNRINFAGHQNNSNSAVQDIMELAQHFLPLELLISLNNNLNLFMGGGNNDLRKRHHVEINDKLDYSQQINSDDDSDYIA